MISMYKVPKGGFIKSPFGTNRKNRQLFLRKISNLKKINQIREILY